MSTNLACPLAREPYVPSQMQINIRSMSVDLVDVFRTLKMLWTQVQILQAEVDKLTAAKEEEPAATVNIAQVGSVNLAATGGKRGKE